MISKDIEIVDVHPEHWTRLLRGRAGGEDGGKGWLWIVHEDGRIIHAALGGRSLFEIVGEKPADLAALKRRFSAGRVICVERDLLRRVFDRSEAALGYDMDFVEQVYTIFREFRRERGTGLRVEPPTPPGPMPPFEWVQFLFDRLWPDGTSVVFYVVDESANSIFTSLVLRKRAHDVDLLTTDLHLGAGGLDAANWRGDVDRLLDTLSARVARPWLGIFATLESWKKGRLLDGAVSKPRPARLAVPMDVVRALSAFIRQARRFGARLAPSWP